ncbi:MAG: chloride channel protein [Deltaproteobacteria bacterium]|nr:chloride channel protein [Deltaproteobacteria bacterium]
MNTERGESSAVTLAWAASGGVLGGLLGGGVVVALTQLLKTLLAAVSNRPTWVLIAVPVIGLALSMLVLYGFGGAEAQQSKRWRAFPRGVTRSDITSDVVLTAGHEEDFPWWLMPIRTLAILATVGLGAAMGTEAPAAYVGVAVGTWASARSAWRRLLRSSAIAGGASGVAALMGIPLMGTAFMLELGWRNRAPISAPRVVASLIGGFIGWGISYSLHLRFIRLVVPQVGPGSFHEALLAAIFVGALAGTVTALTGTAIYKAKTWHAPPLVRLILGSAGLALTAFVIARVANPASAIGPGTSAIRWAEQADALPLTLLAVSLLRAAATISAAAAGGCGGVFVPFMSIGDIAGRVFAPGFGIQGDLAGAAGAAAGISGGYRLPLTAIAMVLGVGGPRLATFTCLATVAVASAAAWSVGYALDHIGARPYVPRRLEEP